MLGFIPNLHVTTEGDHATAAGYVGLGKTLLGNLMRVTAPGDSAQQNHRVNDNVEIQCKVVGAQRFVHIKAQGCKLFMDSGIVDLLSVAPQNPNLYASGVIYYNTPIRELAQLGELVGEIKPPSVKSVAAPVELTAALSFSMSEPTDANKQALLLRKKLAAANVPTGVFTGKMRLFVQALYGGRLSQFANYSAVSTGYPPYLIYSTGDLSYGLTTNCGIYTDDQHRHYIIKVAGTNEIAVYPLKPSACAAALRSKLSDPSVSDADKNRIETYILSNSLIDEARAVTIGVDTLPTLGSFGYGWHFNWSGHNAIIVDVKNASPSVSDIRMESSLYRLSFTRNSALEDSTDSTPADNERRRWAASVQRLEGPVQWNTKTYGHVIASPDWTVGMLGIFKAKNVNGVTFGTQAPIYAFYARTGEMQVLRFDAQSGVISGTRDRSPYYFACEPYQGDWTAATIDTEDGFYEDRGGYTGELMRFSCGLETVSAATGAFAFNREEKNGLHRTTTSFFPPQGSSGLPYPVPIGRPLNITGVGVGCYSVDGPPVYDQVVLSSADGPFEAQIFALVEYDKRIETGTKTSSGVMAAIIPFDDAEAVYLFSGNTQNVTSSGTNQTVQDFNYHHIIRVPNGTEYISLNLRGAGQPGVEPTPVAPETPFTRSEGTISYVTRFVSTHGSFPWSLFGVSMSGFFTGGAEYVSDRFQTLVSSTYGDIFGKGISLANGYALPTSSIPRFVGFA